jgi:hypothetical protein
MDQWLVRALSSGQIAKVNEVVLGWTFWMIKIFGWYVKGVAHLWLLQGYQPSGYKAP